jgi:hypothetical protein
VAEYDVRVRDESNRSIIRKMLQWGLGPRDYDGMNGVIAQWLEPLQGGFVGDFNQFVGQQRWTLGELLSLLSYQCCPIFAPIDDPSWLDEDEFNSLWPAAERVLEQQPDILTRMWVFKVAALCD